MAWIQVKFCLLTQRRADFEYVCLFVSDYNRWTVHGIWPTKDKTMGPFHCSNVKFDEAKIQPILEDLKQHWTNVRKNTETYNFWEHEWTKHGTCAIQLESLNDELKYFQQGKTPCS